MISSKKLIKMAKKWQKFTATQRKKISFERLNNEANSCSKPPAVIKDNFVIYTVDQKRFVVPLAYLDNEIIMQLLEMSEEEFGLPSDGPIIVPCDALLLDYIISLLSRGVGRQIQKALSVSVASYRSTSREKSGSKPVVQTLCRCCAALELERPSEALLSTENASHTNRHSGMFLLKAEAVLIKDAVETLLECRNQVNTMISSKKLIKLAKRWQKFAAIRRKRISFPRLNEDADSCSTSSAVYKGHFTVYTADQKRFVVPLSYLENEIIRQLLSMSEEEFGLPSDGPITLPCDAVFMDYIISLLSRGLSRELENALLVSVTSHRCSSAPLHQEGWRNQELLVC
nr:auxin-responsive protein SAUR68-like [Ipomoea batatas]